LLLAVANQSLAPHLQLSALLLGSSAQCPRCPLMIAPSGQKVQCSELYRNSKFATSHRCCTSARAADSARKYGPDPGASPKNALASVLRSVVDMPAATPWVRSAAGRYRQELGRRTVAPAARCVTCAGAAAGHRLVYAGAPQMGTLLLVGAGIFSRSFIRPSSKGPSTSCRGAPRRSQLPTAGAYPPQARCSGFGSAGADCRACGSGAIRGTSGARGSALARAATKPAP